MTTPLMFTRTEVARLRHRLTSGERLLCPRCDIELEANPVARPPGVSYVRDRIWYICPSCRRSAVLDGR
jgi:hypothetical protein